MINHPKEAWDIFIDGRPEDDELNRRAWRDTVPRLALRPAALDVGRYERFAEFMKAAGLIDNEPPVETYAVTLR